METKYDLKHAYIMVHQSKGSKDALIYQRKSQSLKPNY